MAVPLRLTCAQPMFQALGQSAFPSAVHWKDQSARVESRLVGEYWITSILAALACALELGISLDEAVRIVENFQPLPTRNSVQEIAGGPTFLLDTIKAPFGTIEAAVDTLKSASAPRKTLVLGNISDYSGASSRQIPESRASGRQGGHPSRRRRPECRNDPQDGP